MTIWKWYCNLVMSRCLVKKKPKTLCLLMCVKTSQVFLRFDNRGKKSEGSGFLSAFPSQDHSETG